MLHVVVRVVNVLHRLLHAVVGASFDTLRLILGEKRALGIVFHCSHEGICIRRTVTWHPVVDWSD